MTENTHFLKGSDRKRLFFEKALAGNAYFLKGSGGTHSFFEKRDDFLKMWKARRAYVCRGIMKKKKREEERIKRLYNK